MNSEVGDKEYLETMLGSIQLIEQRIKGLTKEEYNRDLLVKDSIQFRLYKIGVCYYSLSENTTRGLLNKDSIGIDMVMNCFKNHLTPEDEEWGFISNKKGNELFGEVNTLGDLFFLIEDLYLKLYQPEKHKQRLKDVERNKITNTNLSTDYPYSTKSTKSIWTVKNK